jgi:hypothetical protein
MQALHLDLEKTVTWMSLLMNRCDCTRSCFKWQHRRTAWQHSFDSSHLDSAATQYDGRVTKVIPGIGLPAAEA